MNRKIRLGISSCLLGNLVRYDGQHQYNDFCGVKLSQYCEFVSFCPEVSIGLGVPRQPIRVIAGADSSEKRVMPLNGGKMDFAPALKSYADQVAENFSDLRGYVFVGRSPSCGLNTTKIYDSGLNIIELSAGIFAERLIERLPFLPVIEAECLNDDPSRENFLVQIFLMDRWMNLDHQSRKIKDLMTFHSMHKYQIMAYSQNLYRLLGRIAANKEGKNLNEVFEYYISQLMLGIRKVPCVGGHVNALMHVAGYLRQSAPAGVRQFIASKILGYQAGIVSLHSVMGELRTALDQYGSEYIKRQTYLSPYPDELAERFWV